ncbi:MAG: cobalt-precorrin-6A reductase [Spirulinaceae cyanobacterium SM2_1_0]|nr:cobalt-precorrin-6A reductase [Spirulinaceae cyanobacterium SM2_1_0]
MTTASRVLILGGTGEARHLAARLAERPEIEAIASLAGRTQQPNPLAIPMRVGGFGGVAGLVAYLQTQQIAALIDATHPFAAQISHHAATAAAKTGIPHLQLVRPAWQPVTGDRWLAADSHATAAALLPGLATRIFLSIGRQELAAFAHLRQLWFLMRAIEPPPPEQPQPPGQLLLQRGPFTLAAERSLLQSHRIEAIVSKNSGGEATVAKLIAARELGLPVVMVQRPPLPPGERVAEVEGAIAWLQATLGCG